MKSYILILALGILFITGCDKKPKPKPKSEPIKSVVPVKDINKTVKIEPIVTITEPLLNTYDCVANDEVVSQGLASKIVVVKSKRVIVLFDENENILSRHRISLGKNNVGTKLKQGDYKTPEGIYSVIDKRSDKVYYREILISYPNQEDRERSKSLGFRTGGGITIHAQPNWNWDGHGNDYTLANDWTEGCMAVTNEGMDTIWEMIALGTPIEIRE